MVDYVHFFLILFSESDAVSDGAISMPSAIAGQSLRCNFHEVSERHQWFSEAKKPEKEVVGDIMCIRCCS